MTSVCLCVYFIPFAYAWNFMKTMKVVKDYHDILRIENGMLFTKYYFTDTLKKNRITIQGL